MSTEEQIAADPAVRDLTEFMWHLRLRKGKPSYRDIARRMSLHGYFSVTSVWRIFQGNHVPNFGVYEAVAGALDASDHEREQMRQLWLAALEHADALKSHVHRTGPYSRERTAPGEPSMTYDKGKIIVHDGAVHIADAEVTAGKAVEIHGGEIFLGHHAVQAAETITIYGGRVVLASGAGTTAGADVNPAPDSTESPTAREHPPPYHLRRVQ